MIKTCFGCAAMAGALALSASSLAYASSETVLYSFPSGSDVWGQLQEDSAGNLYGTTYSGDQYGTVYELSEHRGSWRHRVIYAFGGVGDGVFPFAALTPDRDGGIFYGTTTAGGSYGYGTIFSLVRSGQQWTDNVLHSFNGSDGIDPMNLMTRDKETNVLYGTAGQYPSCGNAFRFDPNTAQLHVLYEFQGGVFDGCSPATQLRPGPEAGTLIGGTAFGGVNNEGTLFQLKQKNGKWNEFVLYTFRGDNDGGNPTDIAGPADDAASSIYGVAGSGGPYGRGVVFQLSKRRDRWIYRVIYAFPGIGGGERPVGLRLDQKTGLLYGTTLFGGTGPNGVVFKLTKSGDTWSETVLHRFSGGSDGANPESRPFIDPKTGVLYGTTLHGGIHGGGTVYSVTP